MADLDPTQLAALREPFPEANIGKLPREACYNCQQARKAGKPWDTCENHRYMSARNPCPDCGGKHGTGAIHLDFVGHADTTDRLLTVDPGWSWEPVAFDENGEPRITVRDKTARMWIRLTVGGVTRLGVGTCQASKDDREKELIGDAIRNAAMRFGVALSLWSKAELLESEIEGGGTGGPSDSSAPAPAPAAGVPVGVDPATGEVAPPPSPPVTSMAPPVDIETSDPIPKPKKADYTRHKPLEMDDGEFFRLVVDRGNKLAGTLSGKAMAKTYQSIRPNVAHQIVAMLADGSFWNSAAEPFGDDAELPLDEAWRDLARRHQLRPVDAIAYARTRFTTAESAPNITGWCELDAESAEALFVEAKAALVAGETWPPAVEEAAA